MEMHWPCALEFEHLRRKIYLTWSGYMSKYRIREPYRQFGDLQRQIFEEEEVPSGGAAAVGRGEHVARDLQ